MLILYQIIDYITDILGWEIKFNHLASDYLFGVYKTYRDSFKVDDDDDVEVYSEPVLFYLFKHRLSRDDFKSLVDSLVEFKLWYSFYSSSSSLISIMSSFPYVLYLACTLISPFLAI